MKLNELEVLNKKCRGVEIGQNAKLELITMMMKVKKRFEGNEKKRG